MDRRSLFTLDLERSAPPRPAPVVEPSRSRQPGELINDRYRVLHVLGEGGMARVYRVSDALHPERALALKTLFAPRMQAARLELFKAEFRTMAELRHPNIARVYDFETLSVGEHAFTMELLEGADLFTASQGQPLERILDWIIDACRALSYLHSRGVIHADFKPHNVMVGAGGAAKVLDFGLSGGVHAQLLLGTPAYMAPELGGGALADARVDLYALGVTLYQLLFRRLPFTGKSLDEIWQAPLQFPAGAQLRTVIERLCARAPEARYATANEVIEALSAATGRAFLLETAETRDSWVSSSRLVGRQHELEQLLSHCSANLEGRGQLLVAAVAGPSGIGKSRLIREARRRLQLASVPFVEAHCYQGSFGELEPLRQLSQALRRMNRAGEAAHRATLDWLDDGEKVPSGSAETRRMERLRGLAEFVLDCAAEQGFVLAIGDLHWAGSATTDFLQLLCERRAERLEAARPCKLALLIDYRSDELADRPAGQLLSALPARLDLPLAPLSPAETAELVTSLLGEVPEAFGLRVSSETGGNPFFVEEVLRALMERGDVHLAAGRWAAQLDVAELELPGSIAAALERRLSSLDASQREVLQWLAVYAQPMPPEVFAAVSAPSLLRELALRHLIVWADEAVQLAHDRLREFIYERLEPEARQRRHQAIAEALEGRDREYVFERAHHHWHAGNDQAAQTWLQRAAALGEESFATDAAIESHDRLRRLALRHGDETGRRHATDRLLELCTFTGQYQRILAVAEAERALRPEPLERAHLLQLQGEALGAQGESRAGIERLRQAVELLGARAPRGRQARRAFIAWHYLRHSVAPPRRASLSLDQRRRREILAACYLYLAIYALVDADDEGFGMCFAGLNAALPLGRHVLATRLLQNAALAHHLLGHHRLSERLIRAAQELAASDAERAHVMITATMARQLTQQPIYAGQPPIPDVEGEIILAIDLLATRSKTLFAHLARLVATTAVFIYARQFRFRPEVFRWAGAMRGTVHYAYVQGAAAAMAHIDGQQRRAMAAYEEAQAGTGAPVYRAVNDALFAYHNAVTGDLDPALAALRSFRRRLAGMETRALSSLWGPRWAIAACLVLAARGQDAHELRAVVVESLARIDRIRRVPADLAIVREAGRMWLGGSSLTALTRAREGTYQTRRREATGSGHADGHVAAALALRFSSSPEARSWAEEAMQLIDECFPRSYADRARQLFD